MKQLNTILAVIAIIFLAVIALRLFNIEMLFKLSNENAKLMINSNIEVINANRGLQNSLSGLKSQIEAFQEKFLKK